MQEILVQSLVGKIPWRKIFLHTAFSSSFLPSLPPPLLSLFYPSFLPSLPGFPLSFCPVDWKKDTTWELWVKFYWGKMRTIALETGFQVALRNCAKEERCVWGVSIYVIWVKKVHAVKHTFWQKLAASYREQMSPLIILVFSSDVRRCKIWAHKIFPWKYLTIWVTLLPIFPRTQCLIPYLLPEFISGRVEGQRLQWLMIHSL